MPLVKLPDSVVYVYEVIYFVPYEHKDNAKKQGARWNAEVKCWYRTFECSKDDDIKEVSAKHCNLRILTYSMKERTIQGATITLNNVNKEDLIKSGCIILKE